MSGDLYETRSHGTTDLTEESAEDAERDELIQTLDATAARPSAREAGLDAVRAALAERTAIPIAFANSAFPLPAPAYYAFARMRS